MGPPSDRTPPATDARFRLDPAHVPWVVALALSMWAALSVAMFTEVRFDDAYITFRYGQNLASGHGLVFNPGERLMGSTSPGAALLSAVLFKVVGHAALPGVMAGLGAALWIAEAGLVFLLLHRAVGLGLGTFAAALVAAGAAESPHWVAMETHWTAAASLAALVLASRDRFAWAAFAAGVATLFRPDAALVFGLVAIDALRVQRLRAVLRLLPFAIPTVPWAIYALRTFGTLRPQSASKIGRSGFGMYVHDAFQHLGGVVVPRAPWVVAALVTTALAGFGAIVLFRKERRLSTLAAWGALHLGAYCVLRPFTSHHWHLYPTALVLCVLVGVALGTFGARLRPRALAPIAAVLVVCAYLVRTIDFAASVSTSPAFGGRDACYRAVSELLVKTARPNDWVSSVEVGTIAYWSGLPMHDRGGLVTKDPWDWIHAEARHKKTPLRFYVMNHEDVDVLRPAFRDGRVAVISKFGYGVWIVDVGPR